MRLALCDEICLSGENESNSPERSAERLLEYKKNKKMVMQVIEGHNALPELILELVSEYKQKTLGTRPDFLWKWLDYSTSLLSPLLELPCVSADDRNSALVAKSLINMLNVILDDVADVQKNDALLRHLQSLFFSPYQPSNSLLGGLSYDVKDKIYSFSDNKNKEEDIIQFCLKLWNTFNELIKTLPNYGSVSQILNFDIMQMVNGKYWSCVMAANPIMYNSQEPWSYSPHSMNAMIHLCIDVLACPKGLFEEKIKKEFGKLREIYWTANVMAHISNSLATWRREIKEKDFSGLLFSIALEGKLFSTLEELSNLSPDELVERLDTVEFEKIILLEWLRRREILLKLGDGVESLDIKDFAERNEKFLELHLACQAKL